MLELKGLNYNPKQHVAQLDGIRGLAILLVFFNHLFAFIPLAIIGWTGVDLFFVLSGFLITGVLISSRNKENYYLTFIKRRALRIFPIYYLFLLIFFVIYPVLITNNLNKYSALFANQLWFWTYTSNIYFSFNGWGVNEMLTHFWSLSIEEQFYLFWPFIILNFSDNNIIIVSIALILLSIVLRNIYPGLPFSYAFTFCRLDGLAIGSVTAIIIRNSKHILEKYTLSVMVVSALVLCLISLFTRNLLLSNSYFIRFGYTFF